MRATGMFTQKMARQVHSVRNPPRSGPMAVSPPAMPKNSASAFPRCRSGNVLTTMASAAGNMIAPPAPWTTRNVTIQASTPEPLGVRPHIADATTKTMTPITHILVWPKMSESRPPRAKSAAREIR